MLNKNEITAGTTVAFWVIPLLYYEYKAFQVFCDKYQRVILSKGIVCFQFVLNGLVRIFSYWKLI